MRYKVISAGGEEFTCIAKNATDAKRQACRFWGIKQNDTWCGVSAMRAERVEENVDNL